MSRHRPCRRQVSLEPPSIPNEPSLSGCGAATARYTPVMEYVLGILLALVISFLAKLTSFDRDRVFYPMLLAVIASYYVLFAAMAGSVHALIVESLVMTVFLLLAFVGFKFNLWLVVAGLAGHGLLDAVHAHLVTNPAVPAWFPPFCLAVDTTIAGFLAWLLKCSSLHSRETRKPPA